MITDRRIVFVVWVACALSVPAWTQLPGSLDQSFNTPDSIIGQGNGPYVFDYEPMRVAYTADGNILVAGSANTYNAIQSPGIVRVLPNGLVDGSFDSPFGYNTMIDAIAPQPDGRVLFVRGTMVGRLNTDGTFDAGFDDGSGAGGGYVRAIALQPDGRILVAGSFTSFNGTSRSRAARLMSDGSLDTTFVPGIAFNDAILAVSITASGKVLVAGEFTNTGLTGVARLLPDGTPDPTFAPPTDISGIVNDVEALPDGNVLIGGAFTAAGHNDFGRLLPTGAWDPSFTTGTGFTGSCSGEVHDIVPYADGRCLVIGCFTNYSGSLVGSVVRLLPDGQRDVLFDTGGGFTEVGLNPATSAAVSPSGDIVVVGATRYQDVNCPHMVKLMDNGDRDWSFNALAGQSWPRTLAVQADGKILVGGAEIHRGESFSRVIRLLPNGDRDPDFSVGSGPRIADGTLGAVSALLQLTDGRILVGGSFATFNGAALANLVCLLPDGTVDPTFGIGSGVTGQVIGLRLDDVGRILVWGSLVAVNGLPVNKLARLQADGTLDTGFQPPAPNNAVLTLDPAPDGRLVIGGYFTLLDSVPCVRIARLMPDGARDPSFDTGTGAEQSVFSVAVQPDGRVVLCGQFEVFNGVQRRHLTRLNVDGSVDDSFDIGGGFAGSPRIPQNVLLQPDGRVLVSGAFYTFNGHSQEGLVRLEPNGHVDSTFQSTGFHCHQRGFYNLNYSQVEDIALQADGQILAVGYFDSYGSEACNGIGRIFGSDINTSASAPAMEAEGVLLHPVPCDGRSIRIAFNQQHKERIGLRVLDARGRLQFTQQLVAPANGATLAIDFPGRLEAGMYVLEVIDGERVRAARFTVD
jgi:uncharacterized delta-60 repeat protein